jgi:signal transduction histidine kinase
VERDKLIEAGMALSSELSLPAVLQRIIEIAVDITGARYGALGVIADGRLTDFITVGLTDEQRAAIGALPTGHGILGLLIHRGTERTPVRIDDITQHPAAHGFPPNHPPMRSFLGAPIVVRGHVFGDVYLTDKQGAAGFTDEDADAVLVLASQAGVAIENARLYEETERRARWLDAVREVTSVVLTGSDPADALPLIARRAREVLDADLASIAVPDGPDELVVRAADGAHADAVAQQRVPRDGSLSGSVMRSGRTEVVDDVSADPRAFRPVADLGDMGPAVYVPLGTEARPIGALSVVNARGGRPFSRDDVRIVEAFGGQAALAIEYMRAQEGLRQVAVLEDRERIARELHDGVIQALFAVGMGLQATAAVTQDDGVSSRVELAVADIDRVIRDLRNYIFGLRPGVLADRHLGEALRDLVTEFEAKTGVVTVADVSDDAASLLASRAGDVLQLAREALSNVGRHASATTCRLTLRSDDTRCVLEVDDDGVGFDPGVVDRGDGLANLEKRAAELGGRLTIESTPGEGATVRVELPT